MSKYKNPINEVGVTVVYGMDDPRDAIQGTKLRYVKEHELTPEDLIMKLPRKDQFIFRHKKTPLNQEPHIESKIFQ